MRIGCFYKKDTFELIDPEEIEKELPEIFRVDSMKKYKYPKYEYISLLGIICCAGSCYVDKILLDTILYENGLFHNVIFTYEGITAVQANCLPLKDFHLKE